MEILYRKNYAFYSYVILEAFLILLRLSGHCAFYILKHACYQKRFHCLRKKSAIIKVELSFETGKFLPDQLLR